MTKSRAALAQPHRHPHSRHDWEHVRTGRDGSYWQGTDGLVVRVAAAEREGETTHAQAAREPGRAAETMKTKKEIVRIARAWHLVFGR